jgi:hypothetical protein
MQRIVKQKSLRILVCGDREWKHKDSIMEVLKELQPTVIIEGGAKGADTLVKECAKELNIEVREYKADWQRYGRGAGPIRNKEMIEEGRPALVVAFHNDLTKSAGTRNMVIQARKYYIPVIIFNSNNKGIKYE